MHNCDPFSDDNKIFRDSTVTNAIVNEATVEALMVATGILGLCKEIICLTSCWLAYAKPFLPLVWLLTQTWNVPPFR